MLAAALQRLSRTAHLGWTVARAAGLPGVLGLRRGLAGALVQVETTSHCNFRCSYCPTHSPDATAPAARGHMTMATFRRILDDHRRARVVVLQGQGEPLLDPTLFEKIALARGRGLVTQVISNGSLLERHRDRLVREGPDLLLVSLDAVSPARNAALRAGLRWDRVAAGIAELIAARAAAPSPRRFVVGILAVAHGRFDDEAAAALRAYDRLGIDVLFYKQLNDAYQDRIRGYRGAARAPTVPRRLARALRYPVRHQRLATIAPCAALRHDLAYYLWDGQRTACCVLSDPRHAAPAYQRDALLARWRARRMPAECERCSYFAGYPR